MSLLPLHSVACPVCGSRRKPVAGFCPGCGAASRVTEHAPRHLSSRRGAVGIRDDPFAEILIQAESLIQEDQPGGSGHPFGQIARRKGARQADAGFLEILQQAPMYQGETLTPPISPWEASQRKPHQPGSPVDHSPPVPRQRTESAPPQPAPLPVPVPVPQSAAANKPPRPVKPSKRGPIVRPEPVKMERPEPKIEKMPEQGAPITRQELVRRERELTPEQQELIRQLDEFEYDSE